MHDHVAPQTLIFFYKEPVYGVQAATNINTTLMKTQNRSEIPNKIHPSYKSIRPTQYLIFTTAALFILIGFIISCDTTNNSDSKAPEIVGIEVTPEDHRLQEGGTKNFSAFAKLASGEKIPFSELNAEKWDWLWITTDPEVASFTNNGVANGHSTGNTTCYVLLGKDQEKSLKSIFKKDAQLNMPIASRRTLIKRMLGIVVITFDCFGVQVVQDRLAKLRAKHNLKIPEKPSRRVY